MKKSISRLVATGAIAATSLLAVGAGAPAEAGFSDCPSGNFCLWVGTQYEASPGFTRSSTSQGYSFNYKSYGNRSSTRAVTYYNGNTKLGCMVPNSGNFRTTFNTATRNVFSTSC